MTQITHCRRVEIRTAISKSEASFFLNSPSCFFSSPSANSTAKMCLHMGIPISSAASFILDDNTFLQKSWQLQKYLSSSIKQTYARFALPLTSYKVRPDFTQIVLRIAPHSANFADFATNESVNRKQSFRRRFSLHPFSSSSRSDTRVTRLRSAHDFILPFSLSTSQHSKSNYIQLFNNNISLTLFTASFTFSNSNFANFKISEIDSRKSRKKIRVTPCSQNDGARFPTSALFYRFFSKYFPNIRNIAFLQPRDRSHRGRDITYPLNIIDNIHIDFVRSCQYLQRWIIDFIPIGRISCRNVDINVFKQ